MLKDSNIDKRKKLKKIRSILVVVFLLIIFVGFPLAYFKFQANEAMAKNAGKPLQENEEIAGTSSQSVDSLAEKVDLFDAKPIGRKYTDSPQVANIATTDLDADGLLDVLVCDTKENTVSWIRQYPLGTFTESVIGSGFIAPAHVQAYDFDKDGDLDIMVAVLGMLYPNNDKIGSVIVLENDGKNHFKKRIVAEKIARVTDVRAGDLDGDGDLDIAVAQFGYNDGETRWIENKGNWKFESHVLQNLSGPINVIINDIDRDGDLDIVSLVSQEWEEIYCFINDGNGQFQPKLAWGSNNDDFGSSGIYVADIDKDGDDDIIYTNGDSFNYTRVADRPWHGVQWLENKGNAIFEYHKICNFTGAYNCHPADIDKDGDIDLFAVSAFNTWEKPGAQSFIWLENMGDMKFRKRAISDNPTHLITMDSGDFNNDGLTDMVTGGMYIYPPYDRMSRITLWLNKGSLSNKN